MYIPHQPIPTITMEYDLQTALESISELEDQNPALEAFSIWRRNPMENLCLIPLSSV